MTPPRDPISRRAPTSEPDWLTLGQAAKYLGVAQSTIRKWSDLGRVPAFYTPGGHRLDLVEQTGVALRLARVGLEAPVGLLPLGPSGLQRDHGGHAIEAPLAVPSSGRAGFARASV